jgi:hypothetical protein
MQLLEYSAALRPDIQAELERLLLPMRCTIPIIEEQANVVYRRKTQMREQREESPKRKLNRRRENSSRLEGDAKTPKKAKKQGLG